MYNRKKRARYSWLLTEKGSHIVTCFVSWIRSECFRRKTSAGLQKGNAPRWTLTGNALDRNLIIDTNYAWESNARQIYTLACPSTYGHMAFSSSSAENEFHDIGKKTSLTQVGPGVQ
jgi:hypothetical protein